MQSYSFRWDIIPRNFGFLASGIEMTLFLSVVTLIVATALGMVIALMQMSRFRVARIAALTVGEIIRNTPILVQLLWVYYVMPIVFWVALPFTNRPASAANSASAYGK